MTNNPQLKKKYDILVQLKYLSTPVEPVWSADFVGNQEREEQRSFRRPKTLFHFHVPHGSHYYSIDVEIFRTTRSWNLPVTASLFRSFGAATFPVKQTED